MSKNSKQGRVSIRTLTMEARTVSEPVDEGVVVERALNRALDDHYRKVGVELEQPSEGWVCHLLIYGCGCDDSIVRSAERLRRAPENERELLARELVLEIWADECESDLWASTFEEEMYWLEVRYGIPVSERCW